MVMDDLVKRLRANGLDECDEAIARIEELEAALPEQIEWVKRLADDLNAAEGREARLKAKLHKCVGALGDISNGEPEWPDDPQRELDWCRNRATTTLAELKGENDE